MNENQTKKNSCRFALAWTHTKILCVTLVLVWWSSFMKWSPWRPYKDDNRITKANARVPLVKGERNVRDALTSTCLCNWTRPFLNARNLEHSPYGLKNAPWLSFTKAKMRWVSQKKIHLMGIKDAAATNCAVRHPQSEPGLPSHHPECNRRAPAKPISLFDQRINPAR